VETRKLFCLFTDECARANVVTHSLLQCVLFVASSHRDTCLFSLSARQKIMELTPINPTISSSAPAASSSSQRHPQDSSPDNPPSSSKRMWTKKSTKPKKKKRNLNQYKLERKDVPENAKALEVSLSWLFYTFSVFFFKFLQSALQLHIRILWKSLNPKVPSPTPTNEMINQFHACRRNSRGAESG